MRMLHTFLWVGGLYIIVLCSIFSLSNSLHAEHYSALQLFASLGVLPSILLVPFFPYKKMLRKEYPKWDAKSIASEASHEKARLISPAFAAAGYFFLYYSHEAPNKAWLIIIAIVFYIIAVVVAFTKTEKQVSKTESTGLQ
ncbi:MAG: hypothetical protein WDN09_04300 [bacterium]